ncbi:hypothetical protein SDC9_95034 [bioreactor metagenome]|uniref:Uncharacterized protein n=1 Tax=bioreactor metagenome TaxID=1076179 RepID=A0A645A530_9ZZZZ
MLNLYLYVLEEDFELTIIRNSKIDLSKKSKIVMQKNRTNSYFSGFACILVDQLEDEIRMHGLLRNQTLKIVQTN